MKSLAWGILLGVLLAGLVLPLGDARMTAAARQPQQPQQQKPPAQQQPQGDVAISVEVPVVTVEVLATTQHGDVIGGLRKENFRILEDGVPQTITTFAPSDSPITIVMLMEFSKVYSGIFAYTAKYWADAFFRNLNQKDWVALVTFDIKPRLEVDFTQNKEEVRAAVFRLYFPGFSESNVYDALLDTLDKLKDVPGKKSILLLASGIDTFSKHTLDQTLKQVKQTDVTIFAVGVGQQLLEYLESHQAIGGVNRLTFYQAQNSLKTFAQLTGGYSWFPQFDGEIPAIYRDVVAYLRNQYSLAYTPTNRARDGKFRKIKIELVAADGSPLQVKDQKGKLQKLVVYARQGYVATEEKQGD
ncbi:MAG TPA: VWA domain-containing protein [Methylomirabilota bacterium]|nr:VWA domain-containing protein [Methylomirabilota bacterium]